MRPLRLLVPLLGCALLAAASVSADETPSIGDESAGEEEEEEQFEGQIKSYERVVLEGAQVIMSCPEQAAFVGSGLGLLNRNRNGEQKQFASVAGRAAAPAAAPAATTTKPRVKWFRNHVAGKVVNLNYFEKPDLSGDKEAGGRLGGQRPNNQPTSSSSSSLPSAPNVNVNEPAGDRKWGPPIEEEQEEEGWHVNELGELVINRATQYFAGKYTCLAAGGRRRIELLLDVLGAEGEPTGGAHRSLAPIDSIKTPLGDTGAPTGSSERLAIKWAIGDERGEEEEATNGPGDSEEEAADIDDSAPEVGAGQRTRRPIHSAKSELVQMNDLKSVPGLLYTKQQLHCPLGWREALGWGRRRVCGGGGGGELGVAQREQKSGAKLSRCRRRAPVMLLGPGTGNCSAPGVRLVWFKDGRRLEFDANGRGISADGQSNLRLAADGAGDDERPRCRRAPQVGGRSLEIEGPRRENGGQYSCALELAPNLGLARAKLSFAHDNDVSCCDRGRPEVGGPTGRRQSGGAGRGGIETNGGGGGRPEAAAGRELERRIIQTFAVSVCERPANSSDLWATLMEAGEAYARRKLADFRRLKRSQRATSGDHMNNRGDAKADDKPLDGWHLTGGRPLNNAGAQSASAAAAADIAPPHNQPELFNYANERAGGEARRRHRRRRQDRAETTDLITQRGYQAIHLGPDFEPAEANGPAPLEEEPSQVINDLAPVIDGRLAGGARVIGGDDDKQTAAAARDRRLRRNKSGGSQQDKLAPFGATRRYPGLNSQLTGATRSSATKSPATEHPAPDGAQKREQVEQIDQSEQLLASDGANQAADSGPSSPLLLLPYDGASLDESLMWSAGQYLYMHMKALASSPIFGVEVAVEWSNERTNGSGEGDLGPDKDKDKDNGEARDNGSPFATIDVLAGQNLQLQCTAQALGRLPEVKWYKRIGALPSSLRGLMNLARRIGHDLYWPLTELDLLRAAAQERQHQASSFVCSQTTTIFDNLAKQTFTVVNSLQLSQYNDVASGASAGEPIRSRPPLGAAGPNLNLYACIVDADVRHNYATLSIHLRQPPTTKLPCEVSKRLQARSSYSFKQQPIPLGQSNHQAGDEEKEETTTTTKKEFAGALRFDSFRENHLKFPAESYWVPIQNGSSSSLLGSYTSSDPLIMTPTVLSALILFVLTSFVALLYLTVRTYRSLTLPIVDEDCDDGAVMSTRIELLSAGNKPMRDVAEYINASGQCLCHLELDDDDQPVVGNMYAERSLYNDLNESATTKPTPHNTKQVLYDAHVHHGYYCRQYSLPTQIIPTFTLPDHNYSYADSLPVANDKRQLLNLDDCCQQQQPPELYAARVSLFENPFHL